MCKGQCNYIFDNKVSVFDRSNTRVCAVEDSFCVMVKLFSEDGAVVHVACVDKTLSCIFE